MSFLKKILMAKGTKDLATNLAEKHFKIKEEGIKCLIIRNTQTNQI